MLYTIGHSNHPIDLFMDLLIGAEIDMVVDIRSRPQSRFAPWFNRKALTRSLHAKGMQYNWAGAELGGKGGPSVKTNEFKKKMKRLLERAEDENVVVMCSERHFYDCHRAGKLGIWVRKHGKGVKVVHITGDGELIEATDVESEITKKNLWHEYGGLHGKDE